MKSNSKNDLSNDNDIENEESKKIVSNFRSELEKLKQKLGKNYTQYDQNKFNGNLNFHYMNNIIYKKIEPKENIENQKEKMDINNNINIFEKVPSFEELKNKYSISMHNKPNSIKDIKLENNINIKKNNKDTNNLILNEKIIENTNINNNININNKDEEIDIIVNQNKKEKEIESINNINNKDNKYDLINLINLQKETEDEIKNIFSKRELLDLSDNSENEEINLEKKELNKEYYEDIDIIEEDKQNNNNINNILNNNISDFSNISNINNINKEDNNQILNKNNENTKENESPIKGVNNNNNSILDTSMLNSKLVQQIKMIDETSENNRITEEKNQLKLKQIENKLQLDERLTHKNREIRKNAIKELCEMCANFNNDEENKQKAFECFSPWVKYCLEETNSYVIPESLNFFIIFNSLFPQYLSTSIKDFFDNIERYINFGIASINDKCFKILYMIFQDKKLFSQCLNYIKNLFEKLIKLYSKMTSKSGKKRKIYSDIILYIYNNIEDDYNTIKNNIKLDSFKEVDNLFYNVKKNKENKYKFRLYNDEIINTDISLNNKNNNSKINKTPEKKLEKKIEKKEKNNIKDLIINTNINADANDILSVIPNELLEYHFLTQFQTKIKLLETTNNILSNIKNIKDKEKNLVDIYKIINYSIEDSNILIHLEGIKLFENICRLVQNSINTPKLKLLLETSFDKLKDKKSLVKNELFSLFNMIIENKCLESDKFIIFILQFITKQKKENFQVKMGLLEYIKYIFLQQNNIIFYEINKIKEKELFNFVKKIVQIIQKESLSSIKDLSSDLLIILKRRVEDEDFFYEIISELPNYRKKIIKEEGVMNNEEGEYKKNLRRIKSSYSFSKTKYSTGFRRKNLNLNINSGTKKDKDEIRHERHKSMKSNHFERNYSSDKIINTSFTNGKNVKLKNNLINKKSQNKIKNSTKTNFKINIKSQTGGLNKFNQNKKMANTGNIKNNTSKKNNKNNENININKKKDNLLDNIHNLDMNSVEKYSKVIISDFLVFVKRVCKEEKKEEDLSYHFNLIFIILEKILYRIIVLLNENKENKDKYIKLKKLLDEFIRNISKVIILAPCIEQIKGSNKFDITLLETFMDKIKDFCLNKEKFYMNLLLNLYKFCEKDEEYPSELEQKPTVLYFLNYLKNGYYETKSEKLFTVLTEFITETKLLNDEEKHILMTFDDEENENINEDNNIINNEEEQENTNNISNEKEDEEKEISNTIENVKENNDSDLEKKQKEKYNNEIKEEIVINNNNEEKKENIDKINTNNIMTKLKQFQERLNKMPNEKEKETTTTGTEEKKSKINESNKIIIDNKKKEKSEDSESEEDTKNVNNNKSNILKLDENDFQKIEDSIKIMSKRLDNTLNKMNQISSNKNNNSRRLNFINNINTNSINNLNSINVSKISESNNNVSIITSESYLKNNFINSNNSNKEIIDQMIKVIKGELNQGNIFKMINEYFININTAEEKLDFIKILKINLENSINLNLISINSFTSFFDFILTILSYQILNQSNCEQIIIELQGLSENLINFRQLNDMFKILLFLLKKYFPKNLNNKIEDISLVLIKVISYLLKELLKKINKDNNNNKVIIGKEIISEINDLFTITPPSSLTTATPNAMFYKHIFTLLKSITDQIIINNKAELNNIIKYLQENKIVCEDYIQYLIRLQKKFI